MEQPAAGSGFGRQQQKGVATLQGRSESQLQGSVAMIDYFFSGQEYIRVTRDEIGPGTVDPGYPAPISKWNWGPFGANGIDAALYSGGPGGK
jgi:hypothetical protein